MRIAPCTAAPYSAASSGLIDLFGSLLLKNSGSGCASVIQVAHPTSTSHACLSARYLVSQTVPHEAHGITELVHAELLDACSRQRARVFDALEGINLRVHAACSGVCLKYAICTGGEGTSKVPPLPCRSSGHCVLCYPLSSPYVITAVVDSL